MIGQEFRDHDLEQNVAIDMLCTGPWYWKTKQIMGLNTSNYLGASEE